MNNELPLALKLLGDFKKAATKRSSFFLTYTALPKVLEWNFKTWKSEMELLGKSDELNKWSEYYQILLQTNEIFVDIEKRVLTENNLDVYVFFENLRKHIETYGKEIAHVKDGDDRDYVQHILDVFLQNFFDLIPQAPDRISVWEDHFPATWKIKHSDIATSHEQQIVLIHFLNWTRDQLSSLNKKDNNFGLDDISMNLFPEVDPMEWAALLTFTLSSFDPQARLKSVVERPWIFGGYGRIHSYGGVYSEDKEAGEERLRKQMAETQELEEADTIKLIVALSKIIPVFHQTFTEKNLNALLEEAAGLSYPEDSSEGRKLKLLTHLFKKIKEAHAKTV